MESKHLILVVLLCLNVARTCAIQMYTFASPRECGSEVVGLGAGVDTVHGRCFETNGVLRYVTCNLNNATVRLYMGSACRSNVSVFGPALEVASATQGLCFSSGGLTVVLSDVTWIGQFGPVGLQPVGTELEQETLYAHNRCTLAHVIVIQH
jgi:hypothetical protein